MKYERFILLYVVCVGCVNAQPSYIVSDTLNEFVKRIDDVLRDGNYEKFNDFYYPGEYGGLTERKLFFSGKSLKSLFHDGSRDFIVEYRPSLNKSLIEERSDLSKSTSIVGSIWIYSYLKGTLGSQIEFDDERLVTIIPCMISDGLCYLMRVYSNEEIALGSHLDSITVDLLSKKDRSSDMIGPLATLMYVRSGIVFVAIVKSYPFTVNATDVLAFLTDSNDKLIQGGYSGISFINKMEDDQDAFGVYDFKIEEDSGFTYIPSCFYRMVPGISVE